MLGRDRRQQEKRESEHEWVNSIHSVKRGRQHESAGAEQGAVRTGHRGGHYSWGRQESELTAWQITHTHTDHLTPLNKEPLQGFLPGHLE